MPTAPKRNLAASLSSPSNRGIVGRLAYCEARSTFDRVSPDLIAERHFKRSPEVAHGIEMLRRAASDIADTTTPEWAGNLVEDVIADFVAMIKPSAFGQLRGLGMAATLDAVTNRTVIPILPVPGTLDGAAWLGETGVFPVLQGVIGIGALTAKKCGAIAALTEELFLMSSGRAARAIEALIRESISRLVDRTLTDAEPANEARPGGLLVNVTPLVSVDATTDLAALAAAMSAIGATMPALILHPSRLDNLWSDPGYGPGLQAGKLGPFAVAASPYVDDPEMVIALDAALFASGAGVPEIDAGRSPTITMANADNAAPTQAIDAAGAIDTPGEVAPGAGIKIAGGAVGAGTAGVVAQSVFQTYSRALRVVARLDWSMLRTGAVAAVRDADW
jgi:hypothetical protein